MLARNDPNGPALNRAISGLVRRGGLPPDDAGPLLEGARASKFYSAGALIRARPPSDLVLIIDGWACEACDLADGRRQIAAFALPGDVVRAAPLRTGLRALTLVQVIDLSELLSAPGAPSSLHAAISRSLALALDRSNLHRPHARYVDLDVVAFTQLQGLYDRARQPDSEAVSPF